MSDRTALLQIVTHACKLTFQTKRVDIVKPLKDQFTITEDHINKFYEEIENIVDEISFYATSKRYLLRPEYSVIEIADKLLPHYKVNEDERT